MTIFEQFLADKGVKIPSEDREGNNIEACIYGREYYHIEDKIADTIKIPCPCKSKLKKWSCGCQNVRVGKSSFEATCDICGGKFELVED